MRTKAGATRAMAASTAGRIFFEISVRGSAAREQRHGLIKANEKNQRRNHPQSISGFLRAIRREASKTPYVFSPFTPRLIRVICCQLLALGLDPLFFCVPRNPSFVPTLLNSSGPPPRPLS